MNQIHIQISMAMQEAIISRDLRWGVVQGIIRDRYILKAILKWHQINNFKIEVNRIWEEEVVSRTTTNVVEIWCRVDPISNNHSQCQFVEETWASNSLQWCRVLQCKCLSSKCQCLKLQFKLRFKLKLKLKLNLKTQLMLLYHKSVLNK